MAAAASSAEEEGRVSCSMRAVPLMGVMGAVERRLCRAAMAALEGGDGGGSCFVSSASSNSSRPTLLRFDFDRDIAHCSTQRVNQPARQLAAVSTRDGRQREARQTGSSEGSKRVWRCGCWERCNEAVQHWWSGAAAVVVGWLMTPSSSLSGLSQRCHSAACGVAAVKSFSNCLGQRLSSDRPPITAEYGQEIGFRVTAIVTPPLRDWYCVADEQCSGVAQYVWTSAWCNCPATGAGRRVGAVSSLLSVPIRALLCVVPTTGRCVAFICSSFLVNAAAPVASPLSLIPFSAPCIIPHPRRVARLFKTLPVILCRSPVQTPTTHAPRTASGLRCCRPSASHWLDACTR